MCVCVCVCVCVYVCVCECVCVVRACDILKVKLVVSQTQNFRVKQKLVCSQKEKNNKHDFFSLPHYTCTYMFIQGIMYILIGQST